VFTWCGAAWTEQQKLTASDGETEDQFGYSVAISGDTAIVGAPFDDVGGNAAQGSAYVFTQSGGAWTEQQKLTGDSAAYRRFGFSLGISGDTAIVGTNRDVEGNLNVGSAYVFTRDGGPWTLQAPLTASDGLGSDEFGHAVAIAGDTAVVTAVSDTKVSTWHGSAYVFARNGGAWTEQKKLTASDATGKGFFGLSVAISGDTALVGADGAVVEGSPQLGVVYVFGAPKSDGDTCAKGAECEKGFCVDGVCCKEACGGGSSDDCQACSVAMGATVNGTCAPIPMGAVCRAPDGACDVAESCDGQGVECPEDAFAVDGSPCAEGLCQAGVCAPSGDAGGEGCACRASGAAPRGLWGFLASALTALSLGLRRAATRRAGASRAPGTAAPR
jgi:hypothetical protein